MPKISVPRISFPRISFVVAAGLTVAVIAAVALEVHVARAEWSAIGSDWDERAPVTKSLGPGNDGSLADHFFRVEWTAGPAQAGRARITGYVFNDYGEAAINVALRISEIDAIGQPVESVLEPVREEIPGRSRTYFDVRVPASESYRVAVASFDFLESSN